MIGVFLEPGFLTREFLEMFPRGRCALFLQSLTQRLMPLAVFLDSFTAKGFTLAVSSQVDDAEINAEGVSHLIRSWRGNFQCHSQIEDTLAIEQVSLSLDRIHTGLLIDTKTEGNQHTARERQEGHGVNALKVHNARVIDNRSLWPEYGFDALITLIGFTRFTDTPDSQLCGKLVRGPQFAIYQLLQTKLVSSLRSPGDRSDIIGSLIECVHGVKQYTRLFSCRSEFHKHRLFHRTSV